MKRKRRLQIETENNEVDYDHLIRREEYAAEATLDALCSGGVVACRHELAATAPRAFMKYLCKCVERFRYVTYVVLPYTSLLASVSEFILQVMYLHSITK